MSNINISDINSSDSHPAGYELFSDSEGYMTSLSSNETDSIHGGGEPFDDRGDVVGYVGYHALAASAAGATPFGSTPGCAIAATGFFGLGIKEAYD